MVFTDIIDDLVIYLFVMVRYNISEFHKERKGVKSLIDLPLSLGDGLGDVHKIKTSIELNSIG